MNEFQMIKLTPEKIEALKEIIDHSPILDWFRLKAPGTFRHCQNVATYCEAIALDLGYNEDLLKAAGMLHDIGKCFNPDFFIENTGEEKNPHDTLSPAMSYQMITRHVSDSLVILIQHYNMPRELMEIISQHHGTSILRSIYNKAKKSEEYKEEDFRYKTTLPGTDESAILMIVDVVEATIRSMQNVSYKELENTINSTIDRLITDQQLDSVKIGVVRKVREVLLKEIKATFHNRKITTYEEDGTPEKEK